VGVDVEDRHLRSETECVRGGVLARDTTTDHDDARPRDARNPAEE
jgi:hypothetical protein